MRRIVLLPTPFGPTSAACSPGPTPKLTSKNNESRPGGAYSNSDTTMLPTPASSPLRRPSPPSVRPLAPSRAADPQPSTSSRRRRWPRPTPGGGRRPGTGSGAQRRCRRRTVPAADHRVRRPARPTARRAPGRRRARPTAAMPRHRDGRVVHPDRTRVVADRVVGRVVCRERADPEAPEQIGSHQPVDDALRLVGVDQPGPEDMAHVAADPVDGTPGAIQRHGEIRLVAADPETLAHPLGQRRRPSGPTRRRRAACAAVSTSRNRRAADRAAATAYPWASSNAIGAGAIEPSARRMASPESFQPWLLSP